MLTDISTVLKKLDWMQEKEIWPNGQRYLWTDAFGLVLLISLFKITRNDIFLDKATWLVDQVENVLGRENGIRIGEAPDRYGQYYHYLAMWIYALSMFGEIDTGYHKKALNLVKEIHSCFIDPGNGIYWKMLEDLSEPEPGYGYGALDHFHGYVVYKLLDSEALSKEIQQMKILIDNTYEATEINQDLGMGMMLWFTHFFPDEEWAKVQKKKSMELLDELWGDPPGYFCRSRGMLRNRYAFTNYGISIGLQEVNEKQQRVKPVNKFFKNYSSGDEYDTAAITHVMDCNSHIPGELLTYFETPEEDDAKTAF